MWLKVLWAEEQLPQDRQKRDFIDESDLPHSRVKRLKDTRDVYKRPLSSKIDNTFNDELWSQQWYLVRKCILKMKVVIFMKNCLFSEILEQDRIYQNWILMCCLFIKLELQEKVLELVFWMTGSSIHMRTSKEITWVFKKKK